MSKGDTQRPVDLKKFDANYERIFRKCKLSQNVNPVVKTKKIQNQ